MSAVFYRRYLAKKEYHKEHCKKHYHAVAKERFAALRAEMIDAYGRHCKCCGESIPEFLAIDHVHNDGKLHRKEIGKGYAIYRWLKVRGWPQEGFQLLCNNCNIAKHQHGRCPHELRLRMVK